MTPWWRKEPLTEAEHDLLDSCLDAHAQSAKRQNISSVTVVNAFQGSRSYTNAIAAALSTLGEVHGPIPQAYRYLVSLEEPGRVYATMARAKRIPGWGSSFVRRKHDPVWLDVRERIMVQGSELSERIEQTTTVLHNAGKFVFPNAACWSAAVALTLRMPVEVSPWLFVAGRLESWSRMMMETGR